MPRGGAVGVVVPLQPLPMLPLVFEMVAAEVEVKVVLLVLVSVLILVAPVEVGAASPKSDNTKRQGPPGRASRKIG